PATQQLPSSGFRFPLHGSSPLLKDLMGTPPRSDWHKWPNHPIYFSSAIFDKSVHPCKVEPNRPDLPSPCSVVFDGTVVFHKGCYDLLPFNPDIMELVRASEGRIPAGRWPIKGGYEEDGMPLYHGGIDANGRNV
ncbi:hypothetical protein ARMGADRAFT_872594, partial [Armillaria gallica]